MREAAARASQPRTDPGRFAPGPAPDHPVLHGERVLSLVCGCARAILSRCRRLAGVSVEPRAKALAAIRESVAVYADETGWGIGVLSAWLWVFTSERITVYAIEESRAHEVVIKILGREFAGVLVSDCFCAYDHEELSQWLKQKCFAHFLRELAKLDQEKTKGAVRFPRALLGVLREALELGKEQESLTAERFCARRSQLEGKLDALIWEQRQFTDPDNARLAKRLRKQRQYLFTFLEVAGVEATNNRAERALRPAVIVRKTGGCTRTPSGAKTHAILASLLVTLKQHEREVLDYLVEVLTAAGDLPSLQADLPRRLYPLDGRTLNMYEQKMRDLLWNMVHRLVYKRGHYVPVRRGIPMGCSLSPMLGALYLRKLDERIEALGLTYARYMDDWVILSPKRWKLRRAIKVVNETLAELRLGKATCKTFIGRIERGFTFLGQAFGPQVTQA